MNDKAKKLVPQVPRERLRGLLRTVWTGAVAAVIAVGVLFTASASVPGTPRSGHDGELPIRLYGLVQSLAVGETDTAPDGVTLSQVVAVLDRAEREAREQGPDFSPAIAQAAAELGMLYTTYQMQQMAVGENNDGLRVDDAPPARRSEKGDDAAGSGAQKKDGSEKDEVDQKDDDQKGDGSAEQDGSEKDDGSAKDDGSEKDDVGQKDDEPPVVQVSDERSSAIDPHSDDPQAGYVTYEEVVIAAVRLANMLDPTSPDALVDVQGLQGSPGGVSLRENLLDVVGMFGGSTTGYANGRIPADVLCPLEFAPGHMLRCDAAERLTALSAEFEAEFGYPIPMTDSYRSYELQVAVASAKPLLAATPGTSNHGWGLAVDLGNPIASGHSPEYVWLRLHGPDYGWDNPSWAQLDGAKPEPWHFEFFAAGSIPNRAIDPSDVGTWTPTDSATPRYKPALAPKPNHDKPGSSAGRPDTKPSDGSSSRPPSSKPPTPTDKPTPSKPDPTPSDPDPTPSKTPKPTPTPTPSEPEPSPSPSEPSPSPSPSEEPDPGQTEDPDLPPSDPDCDVEDPDGTEKSASDADAADATKDAAEADAKATDEADGTADEDPCTDPEGDPEPQPSPSTSSSPLATVSKSSGTVKSGRRTARES